MEFSIDAHESPSLSHKSMGFPANSETSFGRALARLSANSWLEVQMFYVRVSCPCLESSPELLSIRCSCKEPDSLLEINRLPVSSAHEALLTLRRDRMDSDAAEAIYVCTDNLRATGLLSIRIYDHEDVLVCGTISKLDNCPDGHWLEGVGSICKAGTWFMECNCTVSSSGCAFTRNKGDTNMLSFPPSIELCVAGRYMGSPVILTQVVNLIARRRHVRRHTLDAIPEVDEYERMRENSRDALDLASQMEERTIYQELDLRSPRSMMGVYEAEMSIDDDYGDISWFNTGVRVGVGIGLGMCVGLGIGVGLLMRGYQATTKALRRSLL